MASRIPTTHLARIPLRVLWQSASGDSNGRLFSNRKRIVNVSSSQHISHVSVFCFLFGRTNFRLSATRHGPSDAMADGGCHKPQV